MRQLLMGLIVMGFIACNDNQGAGDAQDTTGDTTYNNSSATDTASMDTSTGHDSADVKAGAGQGTGSGSLPSQDTGTRRP